MTNNKVEYSFVNHKIMLKGVSIADPLKLVKDDKIDIRRKLRFIKKYHLNTIRVPILPGFWRAYPDFYFTYLEQLADACKKEEMFLIIDWHAIGNPVKGETRMVNKYLCIKRKKFLLYDANMDIAIKFWTSISNIFQYEDYVIFEIFNEPCPDSKPIPKLGLSPLYWKDWKSKAEKIINIIRRKTYNFILIGTINWCNNIEKVVENPINEENIAYVLHPYPGHEGWMKNIKLAIKNNLPIFITEWGFKENTSSKIFRGKKESYALPLLNLLEKNKISWIAWCYDTVWGPALLNSWRKDDYTKWGQFLFNWLNKHKK